MTPLDTCPDEPTWHLFLAEGLPEPRQSAVLDHLDACSACSAELARRVASWSLGADHGTGADEAQAPVAGSTTQEIVARLCRPPSRLMAADPDSGAALLAGPPEIPGLTDFQLISRGGMGVVYRATETDLQRPVAVKLLSAVGLATPAAQARARREAQMLARLRHPHVVQIYRSGEVDGVPYLVMEWVPGGTLQERLEQGPVPPAKVATIGRDLALALAEAHALGIIHRDLKPENILLGPPARPGLPRVAKLADFGLARPDAQDQAAGLTESGMIVGTPCYMAPEQTGLDPSLGNVSPASDIHGLGAVMYAMMTDQAPYQARTTQESLQKAVQGAAIPLGALCPRVPIDLRTIVEKCLERSPARRYRSAGDLADDLTRFLDGRPILARPISTVERISKWARRRPVAAVAALLMVVGTVAGITEFAYFQYRMSQSNLDLRHARDTTQQALGKLTDESVERLIKRGKVIDEADREFLQRVRNDYLNWPLEPDPEAALLFRANGLRRISQLFWQVNHYEDAVQCGRDVVAAQDEAIGRGLGSRELFRQHFEDLHSVSYRLNSMKRYSESSELLNHLIAETKTIVAPDAESRILLGRALVGVGCDLSDQKKDEESVRWIDEGLDLFRQIRAEFPDLAWGLKTEIRCLYNAAICSHHANRPAERKARIELELELAEDGLKRFPGEEADFMQAKLLALTSIAEFYLEQGDAETARPWVERRVSLAWEAVDRFKDSRQIQDDAIHAAAQYYTVCSTLGSPQNAAIVLDLAVKLAAQRAEAEPAVLWPSLSLVTALLHRAEMRERTGQPAEALDDYDRVIASMTRWLDVSLLVRTEEVKRFLSYAYQQAAPLVARQGDHDRAVRYLEKAIEHADAQAVPQLQEALEQQRQATLAQAQL